MKLAQKLDSFKAYAGPAMNQKLAKMRDEEGKDIINLGLGDPDVSPREHQLKALVEAAGNPDNHHYPSAYPIKPFYEAVASWYEKKHGVKGLDIETEMIYSLGGAEALYNIHHVLLDPGDLALISDPAYPSYDAGAKIAGGEVAYYPLLEENDFLPDLDSIPKDVAKRAKLIWVNLPNNPTGASADESFFPKLIAWAQENDVWVLSDAPYLDISFDGYTPPSFLKYPGAKEVGIELNTMSKSFNACGWRVGYCLGNKDVIEGLKKVKSQTDRGIFYPLQYAATVSMNGPSEWMAEKNAMFAERRDVVIAAWKKMGLSMQTPKATFYCWGRVPDGWTSRDFAFKLLEEKSVWMIPGSSYGPSGEGYIRISLAQSAERIQEAMDRMASFLS